MKFHALLGSVIIGSAAIFGVACRSSQAATRTAVPPVPAGEVWLTPQQLRDAHVQVQSAADQYVDDPIVTSGRITLDDQRSGHVFSPVTGRVVTIAAQLGHQVKKGDLLAVIESPDIGSAVSDVHKAQADIIASEHDWRRKKPLFEQKAGSAADLEAVPRDAVLHLGDTHVAFFSVGDRDGYARFLRVPVEVDEGQPGAWLVVKRGLERGQAVVTNGAVALSRGL
jgi:cobalt-zinc-cadmium efflux system membrane fusion protein